MKYSKKKTGQSKVKYFTSEENLNLPYIELNISTWLKDSHGLYDYEASDAKCERETININRSCHILRHVQSLTTIVIDIDNKRELPQDLVYVGTLLIDREKSHYRLVSEPKMEEKWAVEGPNLNRSFAVVKDYQKNGVQGYSLAPGNIIRLGRVQFLVLEIRNSQKTEVLKQNNSLQLNTAQYKIQHKMSGSCKICLCEEDTEDDPLINPCNCKGSCQLIHLACLKNWINSKVKKEVNGIVCSYNFSKFQCEICKGAFPKTVIFPEEKGSMEMITIQKPEKPYMILESLGREQKKERILHMIYGNAGQSMKVGRGHQCELRVNDISVSRLHADMRFEHDEFIVKDRQSKFGTLVKFKQQIELKDLSRIQCGRLLLEFRLRKKHAEQIETNSEEDGLLA